MVVVVVVVVVIFFLRQVTATAIRLVWQQFRRQTVIIIGQMQFLRVSRNNNNDNYRLRRSSYNYRLFSNNLNNSSSKGKFRITHSVTIYLEPQRNHPIR